MRALNGFWALLILKLLNFRGWQFVEQVFKSVIHCLDSILCKLCKSGFEPNISKHLEGAITVEMSDTEFVALYREALDAGYEPQIAAMVAAEFKSKEVMDWINEIVGIDLKDPFQV